MILRILFALFMVVVITLLVFGYFSWALFVTIFWNPGRLKEAYNSVGGIDVLKSQYRPVWTCLRHGVKAVL